MAPSSDTPRALFDVPREALVYLGPTVRQEQEPTSSEFISNIQDLPLGVLLCTVPPTSALKQHVQMLWCLDTELDFAVNFCLPSPMASSQPLRLLDGRWELGTSI